MRIPYPERIPYTWATIAAACLGVIQLVQGTSAPWVMCCFCFLMLAVTGVNLGGGLYRPVGAFIFFNAVLTLLIGVLAKAYFGEAADSNLQAPMHLIEAYMLGMAGMCFAALIENKLRSKDSLLTLWFPVISMRTLYIGVISVGVCLNIYWMSNPGIVNGTVASAFHYADNLLPLGIILGVIYTVRSSNGARSVSPFLVFVISLITLEGLVLYSKQGLFEGLFCWALGAGISRFRLRPVNFLTLGIIGFLLLNYCVTVVQNGKSYNRGTTPIENIPQTIDMFVNFKETKARIDTEQAEAREDVNYYNQQEGLLDRLEMVGIDDLLIDEADRDGFFGYEPAREGWENLIPHFIWRDKPTPYFGNYWAHQLALLDDNDVTTGVSFSPSADAYKEGGFIGVGIMETLCFIAVFTCISWILGDVRDHPAAIVLVLIVAHTASEGAIPGLIQLIFFAVILLAIGFFGRYFTPIITSAVLPPERLESGRLITALD